MDLATTYLGLDLPHPLMVGASPLDEDLAMAARLEDAGAAALVMHSLFEEEIETYGGAPDRYLEHLLRLKRRVALPVIASLNGTTAEGWLQYARLIERAGASALELNFYHVATDLLEDGHTVERRVVDIVAVLKESIRIPLAVKLSPFYSALPYLAAELERIGADGLVLFNRFYQPDIDPDRRETTTRLQDLDVGGAPAAAALDRDSGGAHPRVAGAERRRPRADRCRQGRHGGGRRRAGGLGADEGRPRTPDRAAGRTVRLGRPPRVRRDRCDARLHDSRAGRQPAAPRTAELSGDAPLEPRDADSRFYRRHVVIMLKRILVATDFGLQSDNALQYGRALARTFGAALHLLHVRENSFLKATPADPETLRAATLRILDQRLTADDRQRGGHAVLETSDRPAEAIVHYAAEHRIDLIIMGTHGREGFAHLLMGSVAETVVRSAPCPVLIVRHPEHDFVHPDTAVGSAASGVR